MLTAIQNHQECGWSTAWIPACAGMTGWVGELGATKKAPETGAFQKLIRIN